MTHCTYLQNVRGRFSEFQKVALYVSNFDVIAMGDIHSALTDIAGAVAAADRVRSSQRPAAAVSPLWQL